MGIFYVKFVANRMFFVYCTGYRGFNYGRKLSFEEAYKQLVELVKKMESGELPLADSITAYEQGIKLKAYCEQLLKEAELKIETLKVANN